MSPKEDFNQSVGEEHRNGFDHDLPKEPFEPIPVTSSLIMGLIVASVIVVIVLIIVLIV